MPTSLLLQQSAKSGPLLPATLGPALTRLVVRAAGVGVPRIPRGSFVGQVLRLGIALPPEDDASVGFLLDFVGQGRCARGSAHGPSAELFAWAMHALAADLGCELAEEEGEEIAPSPSTHLASALAYLEAYEAEVTEERAVPASLKAEGAELAGRLLAWLAREEAIALGEDAASVASLAAELPMEDPAALYEKLLESDAVEDVFVSETETKSLVDRFRARTFRR